MRIRLPRNFGDVMKSEINAANQLQTAATMRANANKVILDAYVRDAGFNSIGINNYTLTTAGDATYLEFPDAEKLEA